MRRMFSKNQLIDLIEEYSEGGGEITPEKVLEALLGQDINVDGITCKGIANTGNIGNIGDISATGDVSGSTLSIGTTNIKNLFVKIMEAPESTTLTDEQIAQIKKGCFINGTFLDFINPVLFPAKERSNDYLGWIIGTRSSLNERQILGYKITKSSNVIAIGTAIFDIGTTDNLSILNLSKLNGKDIPSYPSNTGSFTLKCVNGTLTWVADE